MLVLQTKGEFNETNAGVFFIMLIMVCDKTTRIHEILWHHTNESQARTSRFIQVP